MERVKELPEALASFFTFFPLNVKNCQPEGMNEFFSNKWILWCTLAWVVGGTQMSEFMSQINSENH